MKAGKPRNLDWTLGFGSNLPALAAVGKSERDGIYFTEVDASVAVVGQVLGFTEHAVEHDSAVGYAELSSTLCLTTRQESAPKAAMAKRTFECGIVRHLHDPFDPSFSNALRAEGTLPTWKFLTMRWTLAMKVRFTVCEGAYQHRTLGFPPCCHTTPGFIR